LEGHDLAKDTFAPLDFDINAPPEIVQREGRRAVRDLVRSRSLLTQLRIGRLAKPGHEYACARVGVPNTTYGNLGGPYTAAFNEWVRDNEPTLSQADKNVRADATYLVINWRKTRDVIERLTPFQRQRIAANGLRDLVEAELNPVKAKLHKTLKTAGPTSAQRMAMLLARLGLEAREDDDAAIVDLPALIDFLKQKNKGWRGALLRVLIEALKETEAEAKAAESLPPMTHEAPPPLYEDDVDLDRDDSLGDQREDA
jgi:hypothetical protein